METFSAWLAICAVNSPVPGDFPIQRPMTRSFYVFFDLRPNYVFFDLRPNKQLSKHWWGWWFETPSRPLWRHCNDIFLNSDGQPRRWCTCSASSSKMPVRATWCCSSSTCSSASTPQPPHSTSVCPSSPIERSANAVIGPNIKWLLFWNVFQISFPWLNISTKLYSGAFHRITLSSVALMVAAP